MKTSGHLVPLASVGSLETLWLVALAQQLSSRGAPPRGPSPPPKSLGVSGQGWSKKAALLRDTSASSQGIRFSSGGSKLLVEAAQTPFALIPKGKSAWSPRNKRQRGYEVPLREMQLTCASNSN